MPVPTEMQVRHVLLTTTLSEGQLDTLRKQFGRTMAFNATLTDEVPPTASGRTQTGVMIMVAPTYEEWG